MSSGVVMSSLLDTLPPRPPTPPRETNHEQPSALSNRTHIPGPVDARLNLHTPPGILSPGSSATSKSTSRRVRKKVGFSAKAEYKEAPVYAEGELKRQQQPSPVSLPRSASKPVKSILKVTAQEPNPLDSTNGTACDPANPGGTLTNMLESTIQQLAGGERGFKLDAYMTLTRAWRASNNLPDRVALQEKMGLFMQFVQRDIVSKTPEGAVDASLVNHALNLLITFLGFPAIASTITNDFGVFIIDHCIRSFEDASVPKDVTRHLMQVISLQNFSPKVMTSDRVGRLVSSLRNIEEHIKGKSIVMSRVLIYRKLVKQTRPLMVLHSDWLYDLFTDMLSNLKDIRSSAISLGLEAVFSIGHEKQLSRKVIEVLNVVVDEKRYLDYYEEKLKAMAKDKHESAVVPQIWSVVILLLRIPLDKWENSGPWLHIIQTCFNSSDFPTKISANHAWSRLVYMMHQEERVFSKRLSTLTTPLASQLRRKGSGRTSEDLRKAVLGGICNLFYYTFKPNTNPALLDGYWESSVKAVVAKLLDPTLEAAEDNLHQASAILSGLFDCTTPRRWREDHIIDSPLVKPEELPAIDSKWIRHNATSVFAVVEPILEKDFLALTDNNNPACRLWQALVGTVAFAASKEIKVSKDTVIFVTEAFNVLQKVWKRGLPDDGDTQVEAVQFLVAARTFLEVMITSLGLLPFTEKPGKTQASTKAPIYTLFSMLSALPPGIPDDKHFADFTSFVFTPFFASKGDKAKMDFAQDLLSTIPMEAPRPYGPWLLVSGMMSGWIGPNSSSHRSIGSGSETPVGHDYRDIVKTLERGIRSTPNLPWEHWESLFYSVLERARDETGDAGVAIVLIEPLAKATLDQLALLEPGSTSANSIKCVTELLSAATQPRDRQAVDAARRRLWGTVLAGPRSSSFDTFDNLYKAVNEALGYSYRDFDPTNCNAVVKLLKEVGGFFDRCNRQLFFKSMTALQDGFLPWLQDSKRLLGNQTSAALTATKKMWDKLFYLIADTESPEKQLETLERLFCATLNSSHRNIVNSSVSLWNRLFEDVNQLEYPEKLKAALVQLQPHVDIVLPGLEFSSGEQAQQPLYLDSLEDFSLPKMPFTRSTRRGAPRTASSSRANSPASAKRKPPTKRQHDTTPRPKSARISLRNTTPRLRHDDSQLQFAAIDTTPAKASFLESQVLTERQKEVRERQKEAAGLFPGIQSSPGVISKDAMDAMQSEDDLLPVNPKARSAATPEPDTGFADFVSSTPTPRRGQTVIIPEHDMTDPPSSPPEPRRNPLAAEIRSRSVSNSLLEDWHFSSSPISGSPNPTRQSAIPEQASDDDAMDEAASSEADEEFPVPHDEDMAVMEETEPQLPTESNTTKDNAVSNHVNPVSVLDLPEPQSAEAPSTPPRSILTEQAQETPKSPKSDNEVFVDAPSSPLLSSPKGADKIVPPNKAFTARDGEFTPSNNLSFDISDGEERSLLRLVVELDSGKADRSEYRPPTASPEKPLEKVLALECIVVQDSPKKGSIRESLRKGREGSTASTNPSIAEAEQIPSSQPTPQGGRSKRKRASSKTQEISGKKRKQHDSTTEKDQVPDSQPALVVEGVSVNEEVPKEQIPISSPNYLSSSSLSDLNSQEAVSPDPDVIEMEMDASRSDDHDVQSQIALESMSRIAHLDIDQPEMVVNESLCDDVREDEVEVAEDGTTHDVEMREPEMGEALAPKLQPELQPEPQPEPSRVQKLMSMLRSGLDELRSVRLSRQEVYQIEDVFMDMKRELYEAEKRGRA
ncbi:Rap1-interacting factor 1 N terminal-domain-containing protein [Bombardia bombarda]|uniref:Rap1-interacting factor 1 N terminal-domain-containing protein n=1 Tax=Bombardia bombarda TaxID=252184 RepID=A0AA39WMY7_9PEZI|nr:Rap1-interacting factor 1 N terminal-domain-containing protein [Bombardia bombarda]